MRDSEPAAIRLKDYQPPAYFITRTELHFELAEEQTIVHSRLHLFRSPEAGEGATLELDGRELELLELAIDGQALQPAEYRVGSETLSVDAVPEQCVLSIKTRIHPQDNTSLEGLYKSHSMFCTQCEAQGFRKITYYLDRPDVMSVFTVTIDADASRYPVLLSNGNEVSRETLDNGLERAVWHDPFPKPAYLFALVAGDLEHIEDSYQTVSGRQVSLKIYVEGQILFSISIKYVRSMVHENE